MKFFETDKPYSIADEITCSHELSGDLVSFVYLLMRKRDDIEDEKGFFARMAYQQWNWSNSEFNRKYMTNDIEYIDNITSDEEDEFIEETREQKLLRDYLEEPTKDLYEWTTKGIVSLRLQGLTYKKIEEEVGINNYTVQKAIEQFKVYFNDYCNSVNYGRKFRTNIDNGKDA